MRLPLFGQLHGRSRFSGKHWQVSLESSGPEDCRRGTCVLTASRAAGDRYSPGVVGRECDRPGRKTTGSRCGPRIESALCPFSARQVQKVQASMSSSSTIRSSSPMEYCAPAWQKRRRFVGVARSAAEVEERAGDPEFLVALRPRRSGFEGQRRVGLRQKSQILRGKVHIRGLLPAALS